MVRSNTFDVLPMLEVLESACAQASEGFKKSTLHDYTTDIIELKVVTNTLFLLDGNDTSREACRKLADCLADATGMSIRSEALGI